MRNLLLAGTAGLFLTLGAAGMANAANPNVPTNSPYTLMNVSGSVPEVVGTSNPVWAYDRDGGGMTEGRSAFVDDRRNATFPFNFLMPWNW